MVDRTNKAKGFTPVYNYIIDLWVPVIGIRAFGLYVVYLRLAREDQAREKMYTFYPIRELARVTRTSNSTILELNQTLQEHKFIDFKPPTGSERVFERKSTTIYIYDPPTEIAAETIREKCRGRKGEIIYKPVSWWLHEKLQESGVDYSVDGVSGG